MDQNNKVFNENIVRIKKWESYLNILVKRKMKSVHQSKKNYEIPKIDDVNFI